MQNYSQTQLSNFALFGGLIVIIANQFGVIVDKDETIFVLAAIWSLVFTGYNYYQRFKRGDLSILGVRK